MDTLLRSWHSLVASLFAPARIDGVDSAIPARSRGPGVEAGLCLVAALVPLLFIGVQVATWIRNIPNWDEFDTVLDLLIALQADPEPGRVADLLFAAHNEHRTLLSRLLFAGSYWIWGGVNFAAIAVVGNLFIVGAVAVLATSAPDLRARLRLAAVLSPVVFQLTHHENFFWGGSSIDHFLVVLAAVFALRALCLPGVLPLTAACIGGFCATYSLAHGLLVWPMGAILLALARRWRTLAAWLAATALVLVGFFSGFHFNPGHPLPDLAHVPRVFVHWLTLAGAAPSLDGVALAPWLGLALLAAIGGLVRHGVRENERFALLVAGWCLAALAMIAWGRALVTDPWAPLTSRYVILSSIAWATIGWIGLERILARTARRALVLAPVLAGLHVFAFAANEIHGAAGFAFAEKAERALGAYRLHGTFAATPPLLYPDPPRADTLLREAEARGLVRLPALSDLTLAHPVPEKLDDGLEVGDAAYFIEATDVTADYVNVRGWAFRPDHTLRLGDVAVVFRAPGDLLVVHATPQLRPDVARAFRRHDAMFAGFDVCVPRKLLPAGKLEVGVAFDLDDSAEFMMTAHAVDNGIQ